MGLRLPQPLLKDLDAQTLPMPVSIYTQQYFNKCMKPVSCSSPVPLFRREP